MQAIILAAGMGKRLGELTREHTKCMIEVNGITLIQRMLEQIDSYGMERIIIVIGYQGEKLKKFIGTLSIQTPVLFVENPSYDQTNNIYSLYLAKNYLIEKDTLLFESDLIFEKAVLDKIIHHPYPSLALVARFESWMDGTVVTLDEEDNIKRFISPEHFSFEEIPGYYKTVNIYKFSKAFSASHYVPFLEAYCKALGNNEYYEQVLRVITLLEKPELKALRLEHELWYEIDDIQDLDIAASIFSEDRLSRISSRYGGYWRYPHILDYCYLVNPYFPNPKLLAEIKANFERLITQYPSGAKVNSLLAGKNFGISPQYVVVGNGAAELIKSLIENLPGKLGITLPTFEEYPNRKDNPEKVSFLPQNPDFSYTAQDLKNYFADKDLSALLLINPDNPSGNFLGAEEVLDLCEWTGQRGILFLLDESFADFADEAVQNTLLKNEILEKYPHLIVLKSISKSYGVPGLRLGIMASSDTAFIGKIQKDIAIWNINSFAEFFMQIYGKYESDYRKACRNFIRERVRLKAELDGISWLRVIPSQANYFLCEITGKYSSTELTRTLLQHNILVKDCAHKYAFADKNYIRIAIRDEKDNQRLVKTLKEL